MPTQVPDAVFSFVGRWTVQARQRQNVTGAQLVSAHECVMSTTDLSVWTAAMDDAGAPPTPVTAYSER